MSFMFNPYPYDDTTAINRPKLKDETIASIIHGTKETASFLTKEILKRQKDKSNKNIVVALDGYATAEYDQTLNLLSQNMRLSNVVVNTFNFSDVLKSPEELDKQFEENLPVDLEKDPVQLFGKLFKGRFEDLVDNKKLEKLIADLNTSKDTEGTVTIVYGCGSCIKALRPFYDYICYFDVIPKNVILRAREGKALNIGDVTSKPIKAVLRRFYYVDFEITQKLRKELIDEQNIDYYIASSDPENLVLVPKKSLAEIMDSLVQYPMRCKPVYLEGVWGGYYIQKLRNLPLSMKNCAWVFDLIPMEVSIVVAAADKKVELPFYTFVQTKGEALMGKPCVDKFGGYFPIRFNYDDSYHSNGNMSIQVHSGHDYNVKNYDELGRQDESYYVVATGHDAKTYMGFNEGIDPNEFMEKARKSETDYTPVDYEKYVSHVKSTPGLQVMIPAGTIHSSGRNQVVLEIGSLTVGSYTYKLYDYLRADFDGKPRPIHTYHGDKVLVKDRTANWVRQNLVNDPCSNDPKLLRKGEDWAEYSIGEIDLMYFCTRRLEFEKSIEDNTNGKFHVLALVDGRSVRVESIDHPERSFTASYMDLVIVPANIGRYVIKNLGDQPVRIHKTMLKDNFVDDRP